MQLHRSSFLLNSMLIPLLVVLAGCSATPSETDEPRLEEITVSGTNIPTRTYRASDGKGITVGELMQVLSGAEFPEQKSYSDCNELLEMIRNSESVELSSVSEDEVVPEAGGVSLKYEFPERDCPTTYP